MFTMGKGATSSYLRKVKLNTRSSTETELVTVDMYMSEMLWMLYFIQGQGYGAECVGLYQDYISTQLLMKNGQFSSGKKTKRIKAKFFFIKDKVDEGEMQILDCPTEQMWADVLTKPLQGMEFKQMRAELMNCLVEYEEDEEQETSQPLKPLPKGEKSSLQALQECVGNSTISGRATDRRIGVSRLVKRSRPLVQRRGRE